MPISGSEVWRMHTEDGMGPTDIAEKLGVTKGRISQILNYHRTEEDLDAMPVSDSRMRAQYRIEAFDGYTCRQHGVDRCTACQPPSSHIIAVPDGLSPRQAKADAMWNMALPALDDATLVRVAQELRGPLRAARQAREATEARQDTPGFKRSSGAF